MAARKTNAIRALHSGPENKCVPRSDARLTTCGCPVAGTPSEQRPVIHRESRIVRRISREHPQDRVQDYAIDDNYHLRDPHEHPLFQTHRLCGRSRHERLDFGRPRISLRAAVSPKHVSDRLRQGCRRGVFFVGRAVRVTPRGPWLAQPSSHFHARPFARFDEITDLVEKQSELTPRPTPANR
jgi:hypothetical protein